MNLFFEQIIPGIIHFKDKRHERGTQFIPSAYKGYNISNYPVVTALKGEFND